jgi:hypothetical protein
VVEDAMNRTSLTLASGRMIDLLRPQASDIDFRVIAEHLAKVNRYCGATRGIAYSVAEHSVRCADAALADGDHELAAYLLCHDMHEAFLGDDTTPKKRALEAIVAGFGILAGEVERAFARLTLQFDAAIHAAAGLDFPLTIETRDAVHYIDRQLLATEWRDLMRCPPPYDFGVSPLDDVITPLPWKEARDLFVERCRALLPAVAKPGATRWLG